MTYFGFYFDLMSAFCSNPSDYSIILKAFLSSPLENAILPSKREVLEISVCSKVEAVALISLMTS